ncbi:MAG: HD domain-containing phosphohydrolase [Conexivisphaerales archaeon]
MEIVEKAHKKDYNGLINSTIRSFPFIKHMCIIFPWNKIDDGDYFKDYANLINIYLSSSKEFEILPMKEIANTNNYLFIYSIKDSFKEHAGLVFSIDNTRNTEKLLHIAMLLEPFIKSEVQDYVIKKTFVETAVGLFKFTKEKNPSLYRHLNNVALYSFLFGSYLKLDNKSLTVLMVSGMLHDIGKIVTTNDILDGTAVQSNVDMFHLMEHILVSDPLLSSMTMFEKIAEIVKYHHERWDGRGYPNRIRGTNIPFLSRILSIVDAFDAMTSERTYRATRSPEDALREIIANKGTQFDPSLVDKFISFYHTILPLPQLDVVSILYKIVLEV